MKLDNTGDEKEGKLYMTILSSKNYVFEDNTIIVQLDIIGFKLIFIADEWAWWLVSMESKSRRNRGKGSDMYMGDQG